MKNYPPNERMTDATLSVPTTYFVLGVPVSAVQIPDVIWHMEGWIRDRNAGNYIAVTGMHGVMEAQQNRTFKEILTHASLVVPDGMPLVWMGRWQRFAMRRRVYGPELLETFCRQTGGRYRHFFAGGAPGIAEHLGHALTQKSGIQVAGTFCPPFRHLTSQEEQRLLATVRAASPDVVWIGLSTPKQESWMAEYRHRLGVPVLVGVGAAFDFCTGNTKQAPVWVREYGFEWFFRLGSEPRRLWRRYLLNGPRFVWNVGLEISGLKKFE